MKLRLLTISAALFLGGIGVISAQAYDDDDIYFNPDKAKKSAPAKKKNTSRTSPNAIIYYPVADYPAADSYTPAVSSSRDIDEYNRRGFFAQDSIPFDSLGNIDFLWTRQIEKYHNPEVVTSSSDPELAQYYYAEPANVNIIVNTPGYWGYPYYDGYYYRYPGSWAWRNYWNNYWWGPSLGWSVGWEWGPSWAWGPGWNWGWGPSWAWGPSWGGGWYPSHRPHRPSVGNVRPPYNNRHNGYVGNTRPGYYQGNSRPGIGGSSVGNTRPSNSGQRPGRYNNNGSNSRPSRNYNSNQNSFSTPSYNSGGFRGGNSGGFGGGGGYRGGGGGSRGGRH